MESIWTATTKMPHYPSLGADIHADVLVIGGGIAGLLCAHQLQRAGVHCVVAEARTICFGTTQNTTAKITAQHGLIYHKLLGRFGLEPAKLYWRANQEALDALRTQCLEYHCDFEEADNYIYSQVSRSSLESELAALEAIGCPAAFEQTLPLPFPTVGAIKFPHQGQFHPRKLLASIAKELTIYENTPVREITKGKAITEHGTIHADAIVVATHFPFLNKHGSYYLKLYQQRSYCLSLKDVPPLTGMYLDAQENGLSLHSYKDSLILGGGGHRTGKPGTGWQMLERFAKEFYPKGTITHRWAAQDCMSLDGIPYIGQYSSRTPGLYVATGFNKWGMTSSMAAAILLTDLITGKDNPFASLFSPSRSILRPQLGINALEAALNLLSLSTRRCPHMGCALKWNPQEHSWDCPCHGSRFTESGKLIDNPATRDL